MCGSVCVFVCVCVCVCVCGFGCGCGIWSAVHFCNCLCKIKSASWFYNAKEIVLKLKKQKDLNVK